VHISLAGPEIDTADKVHAWMPAWKGERGEDELFVSRSRFYDWRRRWEEHELIAAVLRDPTTEQASVMCSSAFSQRRPHLKGLGSCYLPLTNGDYCFANRQLVWKLDFHHIYYVQAFAKSFFYNIFFKEFSPLLCLMFHILPVLHCLAW
jgi:hypothetical protein